VSRRFIFTTMYRIHRVNYGRIASAWVAARDAFKALPF